MCTLQDPPPEHPLEMNTVVSDPRTSQFRDPLIKHVVMEKDVYVCIENPRTPEERHFTRDAETFIEIIERVQGGRTNVVEVRVEDIVCDKNTSPFAFEASCSARDVPLDTGVPLASCFPGGAPQPTDPVEMTTVMTSRQDTVVTMKVDKELLLCDEAQPELKTQRHFYLFTEIVEARAGGATDTIRPTEKKFLALMCLVAVVDTVSGERFPGTDRCSVFEPTAPPPV
jgi:hypothetical protein